MGGFSLVRLRYLGERFVLLSCDDVGVLRNLIENNKAWFDGLFSSVFPWDGSFTIKERFAWVRCRVKIDEATKEKERLEFAHFRVKIPITSSVSMVKDFYINGIQCKVSFEEEMCFSDLAFNSLAGKWGGVDTELDTEAGSEDGGTGGSLRDSVGSDLGELHGVGKGEEATVQCKEAPFYLGKEHQLHGFTEFQESARGAIKDDGPLEAITSHQPSINEGLAENEVVFNEEGAYASEARQGGYDGINEMLPAFKKGLVEKVLANNVVTFHEGSLVVECDSRDAYKEQLSTMNTPLFVNCGGKALEEVIEEARGINKELASHLPSFKEMNTKNCSELNVKSTRQQDRIEEAFFTSMGHKGSPSWVANSFGPGLGFDEIEHSGVRVVGKDDIACSSHVGGRTNIALLVQDAPPIVVDNMILESEKLDRIDEERREGTLVSVRVEQGFQSSNVGMASLLFEDDIGGRKLEEVRLVGLDEVHGKDLIALEGKGVNNSSRMHFGLMNSGFVSPRDRVVKVKDVASILETNEDNCSLRLASRKVTGLEEGVSEVAGFPLKDSNLVDVRVE
ncbi:hypothetical protein VNO80_18767 [Phaseolus coccineus]|uniref:Uncharacterized protein n=1 Tax=Phaseolus coccineus TaxID=3886 RepID=A0AAN9MF89_PHACN